MADYRRYWDLTEKERSGLDEETVESYLAVELMERGVLRPAPPTLETITAVDLPLVQRFGIKHGGFRELDIVFPSVEAAGTFLSLGAQVVSTDYETRTKHVVDLDAASIAQEQISTHAHVVAARAVLKENAARKERNEKAAREYQKACETVEKESADIWNDWRHCRELARAYSALGGTWAAYVQMAGGDDAAAVTAREIIELRRAQALVAYKAACAELDAEDGWSALDPSGEVAASGATAKQVIAELQQLVAEVQRQNPTATIYLRPDVAIQLAAAARMEVP